MKPTLERMKGLKAMKRFLFANLIILVSFLFFGYSSATASIYKCIDNNGVTIFSTENDIGCVLLPEFDDNPNHSKWVGQKMNFEFNQTDIKSILSLISEMTGMEIVWESDVNGKVSLNLKNVHWDQAIEIMLRPINRTCLRRNKMLFVVQRTRARKVPKYEKIRSSDGSKYYGQIKDGLRHGYGVQVYPDGAIYEGEWENDKRHGYATYTFADGRIYKGDFKNDQFFLHDKPPTPRGGAYVNEEPSHDLDKSAEQSADPMDKLLLRSLSYLKRRYPSIRMANNGYRYQPKTLGIITFYSLLG